MKEMNQHRAHGSPIRRRLVAAVSTAGIEPGRQEEVLAAVLHELGARMTPGQWRQLAGWLPRDVRSLAGARHGHPVAPYDSLAVAVAATTGVTRPDAAAAVRAVMHELTGIAPGTAVSAVLDGRPGH